jgi:hypothetical protein
LVLSRGEEPDKYRLRAAGVGYASLIEVLADLMRPKANLFELTSRITRGTSVHPAGFIANKNIARMLDLLHSLAEGLDDEFRLTEKFAAIAEMKVSTTSKWATWPAERFCKKTEPLRYSFWLADKAEATYRWFWVDTKQWEGIVGYLPHMFLGHDAKFPWDGWFWPSPPEIDRQGKDAQWRAQLAEMVFDELERKVRLSTDWDPSGRVLLFDGQPSEVYRNRVYDFQRRFLRADFEASGELGENGEFPYEPLHPPRFFWLCIYPNADATGVLPVLLETDGHGEENIIQRFDEPLLRSLMELPVLGEEMLGDRLSSAIRLRSGSREPLLKTEWRRTARFVERHPLYREHRELSLGAQHVKEYRDAVLRGTPEARVGDDQGISDSLGERDQPQAE